MKIVYWSGTGNTENMAQLIGKGIKDSGKDVEVISVDQVNVDELLKEEKAEVTVLKSADRWYGVTYKEDKQMVVSAIGKMIDDGLYEGI